MFEDLVGAIAHPSAVASDAERCSRRSQSNACSSLNNQLDRSRELQHARSPRLTSRHAYCCRRHVGIRAHRHRRAGTNRRAERASSTTRIVMTRVRRERLWSSLSVQMRGRSRSRSRAVGNCLARRRNVDRPGGHVIRRHAETMAWIVVEMHRERQPDLRVEAMPRKRALPEPANGSKLPPMVGAVIYVRVSTKEQTENLSLPTQLRACEEYCRRQGYEVLERFHEEGESAKTTDRSQLQKLLTYCRLNKGRVHFVVVFNLTRFARDKYDHFALRSHSAIARHLAAVGHRADRRHVHRQADGRRAGRVRAVRQRLSLRSNPRRHEGGAGARTLGVPGADRLLERAARDGQEPDARS